MKTKRSIDANVLQIGEEASLEFRIKTEPQRHKNNFKLNLNLPFLQTCVSISAVFKTEFYYEKMDFKYANNA